MTILAYGQTSSGKTFTMSGCTLQLGLIQESLKEIFASLSSYPKVKLTASYLEIYNESVNDLLDGSRKNLDVRDKFNKGVQIVGLTENEIHDFNDAIHYLAIGN